MNALFNRLANPRISGALLVGGIILAAVAVRVVMVGRIATPQLLCDEFIYAGVAKSVYQHHELAFRGQPTYSSVLYPAVIAPAWAARSMETTYEAVKVINVLLMTSAAIPLYIWARRLVSPLYGVVAVALTLLLPAFVYTGMIMTESAFLPAFVLAAFAIALALERPTYAHQAFAIVAIIIACGVRVQGLVLLGIYPTALVLRLLFDARASGTPSLRSLARQIKVYWPSGAVVLAALLGYIALKALRGSSLRSGVGAYSDVTGAHYDYTAGLRWGGYHLGEFLLSIGVLPASALIVLIALALRRGATASPAERAFLAVTVAATAWLTVEVGLFASRFAGRIMERYMLYAAPLFLLALVVWLGRGRPRPPVTTIVAVCIPAVIVMLFPITRFVSANSVYDSFTLYAFLRAAASAPFGLDLTSLVVIGGIGSALLFALTPRRAAPVVMPLVLAIFFVTCTSPVYGYLRGLSVGMAQFSWLGGQRDWVDRALPPGQTATYLYSDTNEGPNSATIRLLQAEFWNPKISGVYALDASTQICPLPQSAASLDQTTGAVVSQATKKPVSGNYVISSQELDVDGKALVRHPPYVLSRVKPPVRLVSTSQGVYADRWMGNQAFLNRYVPVPAGQDLTVNVSRAGWPPPPSATRSRVALRVVALRRGADGQMARGRVYKAFRATLRGRAERTFDIGSPPAPFQVEIDADPVFYPGKLGIANDSRGLGALVSFGLKARAEPAASRRPAAGSPRARAPARRRRRA